MRETSCKCFWCVVSQKPRVMYETERGFDFKVRFGVTSLLVPIELSSTEQKLTQNSWFCSPPYLRSLEHCLAQRKCCIITCRGGAWRNERGIVERAARKANGHHNRGGTEAVASRSPGPTWEFVPEVAKVKAEETQQDTPGTGEYTPGPRQNFTARLVTAFPGVCSYSQMAYRHF